MSIEEKFGSRFKSETRSSGMKLVREEKVSLTSGTDTTIQAYIRLAPPVKVTLSAAGVGASELTASCSCPSAKKAQFCKHVWAVLSATQEKYPDFLSAKSNIGKPVRSEEGQPSVTDSYAETAKARAAEYRKAQYQKQKQLAKERRRGVKEKEGARLSRSLPEPVEAAIEYFTLNGFPMPEGPDAEILAEAKRKLSRVFHPDKGGTHAEIIELNERYAELMGYLGG